jgi:hypothetical protein
VSHGVKSTRSKGLSRGPPWASPDCSHEVIRAKSDIIALFFGESTGAPVSGATRFGTPNACRWVSTAGNMAHLSPIVVKAPSFRPAIECLSDSPSREIGPGQGGLDLHRHRPDPGIPAGTGPFPILRSFHQATADGVEVQVLNQLPGRVRLDEISIVAGPSLPEPSLPCPIRAHHSQPFQPGLRCRFEVSDRLPAHGPLDPPEDLRDPDRWESGVKRAGGRARG